MSDNIYHFLMVATPLAVIGVVAIFGGPNRPDCEAYRRVLARLSAAAEPFAADQSNATDPRVGMVQPVTVAECEELNESLRAAMELIDEQKGGE